MDARTRDRSKRTVRWCGGVGEGRLVLIDQRKLPHEEEWVECWDAESAALCIRDMVVRGAPAIGAAGAFAMVLAARNGKMDLVKAKEILDAARPTAVNLSWATSRMLEVSAATDPQNVAKELLEEAERLADQDVEINIAMARHGAKVVPNGANILHHCNTGALATVDVGTAIGVIYECHHQGKSIHVWVDETRPRLQGARLSAWELMRENVPMTLIADNASGLLMQRGKIDICLYGADRVAANGDVANKVGTYKLSVVAREHGIPVYPVVPTSTIDLSVVTGDEIPIEERDSEEVTNLFQSNIAPEGVKVYNPAFDVTPAKFITGIITEQGICYPPFEISLKEAKERANEAIAASRRRNQS